MVAFNDFVLSQLPAPPGRVLELGCGDRGGVVLDLEAAGYDPLGIDPHAPEGARFRRIALDELDDDGQFVAVVASRVLHHVEPLAPALAKLADLAPLIVVDDFGPERVDDDAQEWYEGQHRALRLAGQEPTGPARLDEWRTHHPRLHPSHVVLAALRDRYDETFFEWRPYLYRWLGGVATEQLEETLVATNAIPAIGFRFVGTATES